MAALCAASLAGCDKVSSFFGADKKKHLSQNASNTPKTTAASVMLLPDFVQLVQSEGPAVVNIQAAPAPRTQNGSSNAETDSDPLADSDPFYEFFKRLVPNMPEIPKKKQMTAD